MIARPNRRFADAGLGLRLALESGDMFLLRSLAARGFATAVLPRSLTRIEGPAIEIRSLHPLVQLPVALVWRRNRTAPPAARAFIDVVRREAANTTTEPHDPGRAVADGPAEASSAP
jgi:DNA-binding transcriptional LysR family regulator